MAAGSTEDDPVPAQPPAGDPLLRTKLIRMHSRRARDTPVALRLYDEMRAEGVPPDAVAYNTVLAAAGLGQHWARVQSTLGDMGAAGVGWDAFTVSALLSACQACGQWRQALAWFQAAEGEAARGGGSCGGLALNVVHYTTLMSCLQRAGQVRVQVRLAHGLLTGSTCTCGCSVPLSGGVGRPSSARALQPAS